MTQTQPNPATPAPSQIKGPRPLPLLMAIQSMTWMTSQAALPALRNGSLDWRPELADPAAALARDLEGADPDAFVQSVIRLSRERLCEFADGVKAYRHLARPKRPARPPAVWSQGQTRLFDYGATHKNGKTGAPLLVVPSLVNRSTVLDLLPGMSLLRDLAARGFRPLLVDWDWPGETEMTYGLDDYIGGVLEDALKAAVELTGRAMPVMGYCMGGNLALALAQRRPIETSALLLLATPWDFDALNGAERAGIKAMRPALEALLETAGFLPVDVMQSLFIGLDPYMPITKFRRFANTDKRSKRAKHFLALEDWLNDGVPLAAKVARECLFDWYLDNAPMRGTWTIRGRPVRPEEVTAKTLLVVPERDHIVPPGSALPLADSIPGAECWPQAAGHIGMVAGSRAARTLYEPLSRWIRDVT